MDEVDASDTGSDDRPDELGRFRAEIEAAIARSRKLVAGWLAHRDPRIPLISLIRAYDYHLWVMRQKQAVPPRVWQNFRWGLNEALDAAQVSRAMKSSFRAVDVDDDLFHPLTNALQAAGQIRLARHFLAAIEQGLLKVSSLRPGECDLVPRVDDSLAEAAEYLDLVNAAELAMDATGVTDELHRLRAAFPALQARMARSLKILRGGTLEYDPDEEVRRFFRELSRLEMHHYVWTWDEFPRDAKFGGIPFGCYCDWAGTMAGIMRMHGAFVTIAAEKSRRAVPINLLTLPIEFDQTVAMARAVTNLNDERSALVVRTSAVGSWNWERCLSAPRGAAPPQYAMGEEMLLWSYAACTDNPLEFTVRELERLHPRDWSENTRAREANFRSQLATLLADKTQVLCLPKGLWIESSIGKTDIDLVAIDFTAGVMGAFQLKWQRMLGADMKARRTQGGNLVETANLWVGRVNAWAAEGRMQPLLASSGIGRGRAKLIKECKIFVVGRHVSRMSGSPSRHSAAAWGNWWQIKRLQLEGRLAPTDIIRSLHAVLLQDTPEARMADLNLAVQRAELHGLTLNVIRPRPTAAGTT
jgi:hypothetical protein